MSVRQRLEQLLALITGPPGEGRPEAPVDAVLLWPAVARVPGAPRRLHGDLHPPA